MNPTRLLRTANFSRPAHDRFVCCWPTTIRSRCGGSGNCSKASARASWSRAPRPVAANSWRILRCGDTDVVLLDLGLRDA